MTSADGGRWDPAAGRSVYLVARREFVTRVRGKTFRIGTALIVLLVVGYATVQARVRDKTSVTTVGFTGSAQVLAKPLQTLAPGLGLHLTVSEVAGQAQGERQVRDGNLDVLVSGPPTSPRVLTHDPLNATLRTALTGLVRQQVLATQLTVHGVEPRAVEAAVAGATLTVQSLTHPSPGSTARRELGFIVGAVLYAALVIYGNQVAQGVIEEKASRIVEILLATIRPDQLLLGKVVGIGLVGLLQLAIIAAAGLVIVTVGNVVTIPAFGAGTIAGALLWFVLGFVLYATLYAAAGSLVSRQEDATQATLPITMGLIVAFLAGTAIVVRHPTSFASTVLSLVPFLAPVLMPVRMAAGAAAWWQIALAILLMAVAIAGAIWLGARIYTVAVLRTGARVSLTEALRRR